MAIILNDVSRTFNEYLLIPGLTKKEHNQENILLKAPLVKFKKDQAPEIELIVPFVSAIMQSVSDNNLAVALAQNGGLSFIYGSQSIKSQTEMILKVKSHKAGFVKSRANLGPTSTIGDALRIKKSTGFSTIGITEDGSSTGKLIGLLTSRDFHPVKTNPRDLVEKYMTPMSDLIISPTGTTLREANDTIWKHKLNCLPIVDANGHLDSFVFRKDYDSHKLNPNELLDNHKKFLVGAGINTKDYKERVPELLKAGADVLCIDSSDGYSEWQAETIQYIKKTFGDHIKVGAGNIIDADGFNYLADAGADFIKVGIGGGSICITREQKGIGRGQATALIDVAKARDQYFEKHGVYIPICSDGGIVQDYHMVLALAMGADFLMMGRYFARFDESPTKKVKIEGSYYKEYWGEGSNRARNWQRYDQGEDDALKFEEGVDSYVPYAGKLKENLNKTIVKIKSTISSCGSSNLEELKQNAKITLVSSTSIIEGGAHDVLVKTNTSQ